MPVEIENKKRKTFFCSTLPACHIKTWARGGDTLKNGNSRFVKGHCFVPIPPPPTDWYSLNLQKFFGLIEQLCSFFAVSFRAPGPEGWTNYWKSKFVNVVIFGPVVATTIPGKKCTNINNCKGRILWCSIF